MRPSSFFLLVALCTAAPACAAPKPDDAPAFLVESERPAPSGRAVLILLVQPDIETSIDTGRVAADQAGGLIDAIIIGAMDKKKEIMAAKLRSKARDTVRPLHIALATFDVAELALATTKAALAKIDWFHPLPFTVSRDGSAPARAAFIEDAPTPQLATISYRYDLSPDFTQIRVTADLILARRSDAKGSKAPATTATHYRQRIVSIVQLRKRSYIQAENVAAWAADDGALARDALTGAFAEIEQLIPYALALGAADIRAFTDKNRAKAYAAGLYGPRIEWPDSSSSGVLIWSGGLIHIQQTP